MRLSLAFSSASFCSSSSRRSLSSASRSASGGGGMSIGGGAVGGRTCLYDTLSQEANWKVGPSKTRMDMRAHYMRFSVEKRCAVA